MPGLELEHQLGRKFVGAVLLLARNVGKEHSVSQGYSKEGNQIRYLFQLQGRVRGSHGVDNQAEFGGKRNGCGKVHLGHGEGDGALDSVDGKNTGGVQLYVEASAGKGWGVKGVEGVADVQGHSYLCRGVWIQQPLGIELWG